MHAQSIGLEAGEVAQSIKCLPKKTRGPMFNPQNPGTSRAFLFAILELGKERKWIPGAQWPARLAESANSQVSERPCLHKQGT